MKSDGKPSHSKAAARDVNADRVKRRGLAFPVNRAASARLRRTMLLFCRKFNEQFVATFSGPLGRKVRTILPYLSLRRTVCQGSDQTTPSRPVNS